MVKARKKRWSYYQRCLRAAFDVLEDRRLLSASTINAWNEEWSFALSKSVLVAGSGNSSGSPAVLPAASAASAAFNPSVSQIAAVESPTSTDAKPQSKTWTHDGRWFSVFADTSGTHVWRLDGLAWTKVLTLSNTNFKADIKSIGDVTHVLLFKATGTKLSSIQYKPATAGWELWTQRPSLTSLSLSGGAETATVDIDSTGRMWAVSDANSTLEVRYSDAPYRNFSPPITIATGLSNDDIAGVIALPGGTIGVFWSNQITKRFGFKTHHDSASPDVW